MKLWIFASCLWVCAGVVGAQVNYVWSMPTAAPTGSAINTLTTAHVVGGPAPDFIVGQPVTGVVSVFENTGIQSPPILRFSAAVVAQAGVLAAGDVDGDGDIDVVTSGPLGTSILTNGGTTISRTDFFALTSSFENYRIVDIDQDGDTDIVRGSQALLKNSSGGFGETTLCSFNGIAFDGILGDYDADGDLDFCRLESLGSTVEVFLNSGGATFPPTPSMSFPRQYPGSLAKASSGDLDGDGRDDLLVRSRVGSSTSFSVVYSLLSTTSGFQATPAIALCPTSTLTFGSFNFSTPLICDLDGDGRGDCVTSNHLNLGLTAAVSAVSLMNTGTGSFVAPSVVFDTIGTVFVPPSNQNAPPIVADDLDGDGDGDVVVVGPAETRETLFVHGGSVGAQPASPSPTTTIVSGDLQSTIANSLFAQPLVVEVTNSVGQTLSGVPVAFNIQSGPALFITGPNNATTSLCVMTDANGRASVSVKSYGYQSASAIISATAAQEPAVQFNLTIIGLQISIVSGNNQTTMVGEPFPQPCVARVTDSLGQPIAGISVSFTPSGLITTPVAGSLTNSAGEVSITPAALGSPGNASLNFTLFAPQLGVGFNLTVGLPTITALSGGGQATDLGEFWPTPLAVEVRDPSGQVVPNHPVRFRPTSAGTIVPGEVVVTTDGLGRATLVAGPSATASGAVVVTASSDALPSTPQVSFSLFARRLDAIVGGGGSILTLVYRHEDGPQAFLLAVDFPQPAPVVTPYGTVMTSILAPNPTVLLLDPLGTVGIFDPGLVANPVFARTYNVPPGFSGPTYVLQIYGFDPTYAPDLTQAIFVSNAASIF